LCLKILLGKTAEDVKPQSGLEKEMFNTKDATSGTETSHLSGAPEFTPVSSGVHVARFLDFCVVFLWIVFSSFLLAIVLSVLRFKMTEGCL
jgi:hypothetical protein